MTTNTMRDWIGSDETDDEDGPEVVYVDDRPPSLRGAWDDLDDAYGVTGLWSRYARDDRDDDETDDAERVLAGGLYAFGKQTVRESAARKVAAAHKMIQGFVTTFAPAGERYEVTFDPTIEAAKTDLTNRKVAISALPLFDPTLDFEQAGAVLLAMAAHEASHTRYGKRHALAIQKAYPDSYYNPEHKLANQIGNILDDVAIEREYAADYPGFDNIFQPATEYIARSMLAKAGLDLFPVRIDDHHNIVSGALRWSAYVDWSDPAVVAERDWVVAWADRALANRTVKTHVAAVAEALEHFASRQPEQPEQPLDENEDGTNEPQDQPKDDDKGEGKGQSDAGQSEGEDEEDEGESDADSGEDEGESKQGDDSADASSDRGSQSSAGTDSADETQGKSKPQEIDPSAFESHQDEPAEAELQPATSMPGCLGEAVIDAARENDAKAELSDSQAQQAVAESERLVEVKILHGGKEYEARGEVIWSTRGLRRGLVSSHVAGAASAAIRAAFARSRTGHGAIDRHLSRGSLDNRNLHRIGAGDDGIFHRKRAVSPGKYRVWLMVDCSGSMTGNPIVDATSVATALAQASHALPNVTLDIFGWTTPSRRGMMNSAFIVQRVWTRGLPVDSVAGLRGIPMGGTPDGYVFDWAAREIVRQCSIDETPIIIMASDGAGFLNADAIKQARKHGVGVVSVAIGWAVRKDYQERVYGAGNYIEWGGSILAAARPLGQMLGRLAAGKSQRG